MKSSIVTSYTKLTQSIALLRMDNPPVNSISQDLRESLVNCFNKAEADQEVKAIILTGKGRFFSAGAEIREFESARASTSQAPVSNLNDVINLIESSTKITVAAVNGYALGGGFELSLGCLYRVALRSAKFGLPEVNLGILPGAGGTQRLPRVIGAKKALNLMLSGRPLSATKGLELGVFDSLVDGDVDKLIEETHVFIEQRFATNEKKKHARDSHVFECSSDVFKDAGKFAKRFRGGEAACAHIIDCVKEAVKVDQTGAPFEQGLKAERNNFVKCMANPQSSAMQYMFFAEREAPKFKSKETPRQISSVGIIGAGLMGGGIAMCCVQAGITVRLLDISEKALKKGLAVIRRNYQFSVRSGRLSQEKLEQYMKLIETTTDYNTFGQVDMVIEAVFEDIEIKKKVFSTLNQVTQPDTLLCSNTSALDIDEIASAVDAHRRDKVMGAHFFSPANKMRLLENVRAKATSEQTIVTLMAFGKRIGKVPVLVGNCHGFVGNRMIAKYSDQARAMLIEGALPAQIDKVALEFGMKMGPFQMADLVGLDLRYRQRVTAGIADPDKDPADALCAQGRLGQKNGRGFYVYDKRSRSGSVDVQVEQIIAKVSDNHGVQRRKLSPQEIHERLFFPLINEGFQILEEHYAQRPSDIDVIYHYGYGFPRYRGGPMYMADFIGLPSIYHTLSSAKWAQDICISSLLEQCV
eukprot:CAMPEP_0201556888 /NCGR_PEP_ID=MMETSP0173_2-20130828/58351_1 /ASSEMBLY_ACC=CAM_ASM_000268 /TAXON_ID=218659 /ORGANISM="Vexillifera sp., Strain DIVA3 564/2" /LENGTH=695 /DNA_ID=CAMNT_0047969447 /DNA_START=79 /DNA_END=2162 /DNA_ORIENTATION=-